MDVFSGRDIFTRAQLPHVSESLQKVRKNLSFSNSLKRKDLEIFIEEPEILL
jgi:hypothetical protein